MGVLIRKVFRDIAAMRTRAVLVVVLIMMSVGLYSGLEQSGVDLHRSYERTYDELNLADIWMDTTPVPENTTAHIESTFNVKADGRLVTDIRIEMGRSTMGIRGLAIGIPAERRPLINDIDISSGRYFQPGDIGSNVVILEKHFADARGIGTGDEMTIRAAGTGIIVKCIGIAISPEYLIVGGDPGQLFPSDGSYGVVFVPLQNLQNATGLQGMINNICIRSPDPNRTFEEVLGGKDPMLGPSIQRIQRREDVWSYWSLEQDLKGFDALSDLISALVLIIAGFGTGMAISRLIASHRREIGIMKALGVDSGTIFTNYLILTSLLALTGAGLGIIAGKIIGMATVHYYGNSLKIPLLTNSMDGSIFGEGFMFGVGMALLFSIVPLLLSTRLKPVEAMMSTRLARPGRLSSRLTSGSGLTFRLAVRNIARRKERAAMTSLGIALALILPISMIALFGSMAYTVDEGFDAERWNAIVSFDGDHNASTIQDLRAIPGIDEAEPIMVGYGLVGDKYYGFRGVADNSTLVRQDIVEGRRLQNPQDIVMDEMVADEQGYVIGDLVTIRFVGNVTATFTLVGLNSVILQGNCYISLHVMQALTSPGNISGAMLRGDISLATSPSGNATGLFDLPYVISVTGREEARENMHELILEFSPFINVFLVLGLMIGVAIVTTAVIINVDERTVEIGTMKAIGAPDSLLMGVIAIEKFFIALGGGLFGIILGREAARASLEAFSKGLFKLSFDFPGGLGIRTVFLAFILTYIPLLAAFYMVRKLRVDKVVKQVSR